MYEEVEYLWKNFSRALKAKDEVINKMCENLEVADLDHRRLQEAHMDVIDTLIGTKFNEIILIKK